MNINITGLCDLQEVVSWWYSEAEQGEMAFSCYAAHCLKQ